MSTFWEILASYWWVFLIFGGGILDFFAETFNIGIGAARKRRKAKRKHELEKLRLQLEIARARSGAPTGALTTVKPGPCVHRNVSSIVLTATDEVVGWLCKTCGEKLPADWSVRAEDL